MIKFAAGFITCLVLSKNSDKIIEFLDDNAAKLANNAHERQSKRDNLRKKRND